MSNDTKQNQLKVDGIVYDVDALSGKARMHLEGIQFCDRQIQNLENEWAIADTARIGYTNALKREHAKAQQS